jgi:hypothetical protein
VAVSLSSFYSGALFGVFMLGIYVPWANSMVNITQHSTKKDDF